MLCGWACWVVQRCACVNERCACVSAPEHRHDTHTVQEAHSTTTTIPTRVTRDYLQDAARGKSTKGRNKPQRSKITIGSVGTSSAVHLVPVPFVLLQEPSSQLSFLSLQTASFWNVGPSARNHFNRHVLKTPGKVFSFPVHPAH